MDNFEHAKANPNPDCPQCHGKGVYMYDHNHETICDLCCKHDRGYFQLKSYYDALNGKWCCRAGCGHILDTKPEETKS